MNKKLVSLVILTSVLSLFITGCLKEVEDETPPVIIVLGNNPQYMRLNTSYKDTGVLVTDNNSIFKITTDVSQLDTSKAGRYNVLYIAEDFNNNTSQQKRVVVVRIEGPNLEGQWIGQRTEPLVGGTAVAFEDSLASLGMNKIKFINIGGLSTKTINSDLLGNLGDTLAFYNQIVQITDTSVVSISGAGKIASDGKSFEIGYQRIIDISGDRDTLVGKLVYQKKN